MREEPGVGNWQEKTQGLARESILFESLPLLPSFAIFLSQALIVITNASF